MATFVMRKGKFVPIEEAEPLIQVFGRGPAVHSDCMPPTKHMCDGKIYESKAHFREVTRAHGCIEVGNESAHMLKPRKPVTLSRAKRREDIKRAISSLSNGPKRRRRRAGAG